MLCLIYPYKLPDYAYVDEQHPENNFTYDVLSKIKILSIVENNNNDYGIIRYKDDNYQCSDYWFYDIPADVSEESHKKRKEIFISGSEASWFFDSWMAICYAKVLEELLPLQDETYTNYKLWAFNKLHYHINKALAFVDKAGAYRSDGTKTTEASLPESYTVVTKNRNDNSTAWYRLASPVDPLRWAQSSMILMLDVLSKIGDNIIPQTLPTN